jgi:hypothetical protein
MKKLISFILALFILTMPVTAFASKRTYSGRRNLYKANYTKSYNVSRRTSKVNTKPVIASVSKRTYSGKRNPYKANYTKSYNVSRSISKVNTNKINYTTTYVGSRNTHKFHNSSCRYVKRMDESNKVYDKSKNELTTNGYVPCKICKP